MTPDLFSYQPPPRYPFSAGYKENTTSKLAADKITPTTSFLRDRVLDHIRRMPNGATADEVAALMGEDLLNVRPRFSELKLRGLIEKTGERRQNQKGNSQLVWRSV